jgi:hypothetical protein
MISKLPLVIAILLEKAAIDNGFDVAAPAEGGWLGFGSSQTRLRIWLSARVEALPRPDVIGVFVLLPKVG